MLQLDKIQTDPLAGTVASLAPQNGEQATCLLINATEDFVIENIAGAFDQRVLFLVNQSEFTGTLSGDGFATEASLPPGSTLMVIYNTVYGRWVILGVVPTGSLTVEVLEVLTRLMVDGTFVRSGRNTIPLVGAGPHNNVAIFLNSSRLNLIPTVSTTITGFTPNNGEARDPYDGEEYSVTNNDAANLEITFAHDSAGSDFPFLCPALVDRILLPGETITIFYDADADGWRVE